MEEGKRKKVGLALGGGYARGLAHIGVLEVFEREGIPVDMIAGTSIGALVGALYAREMDPGLMKRQAQQIDILGITALVDLTVPHGGFVAGKRVTSLLKRLIGDVGFKDLKLPLACVATDILTGDEVIMKEGPVLEAVRASISIPLIFTVVKAQGHYLVDGGLVNPVPVSVLKAMGADIIIAVDVTPNKAERADYLRSNHKIVKAPGLLQVLIQSIYISTYLTSRTVSDGADIIIHPQLAHINPGDFHRASECILEGELAAEDNIAHIKRCLKAACI